MEPKLSDRQGQRGQNCHVVLSGDELGLAKGFTSELTEGKAGRHREQGGVTIVVKGTKIYGSVGSFLYAPLMASLWRLLPACSVIKVCCKTCTIKTVGGADLLGSCFWTMCCQGLWFGKDI